jgi:hypothetical protein
MRRKHNPAAALTVEVAPLYRCGTRGKRYKTKHGAYMAEASRIFYAVHIGGTVPMTLNRYGDAWEQHLYREHEAHDRRVIRRLARWLQWRDGRRVAIRYCDGYPDTPSTEELLEELALRLNMQRPEACELMRLAEQELV